MNVKQLNPNYCWSFLITDDKSKEAVLIDPVLEHVPDYLNMLHKDAWKLSHVIDTHTHADHISGAASLKDKTGCDYLMFEKAGASCPSLRVRDGQSIKIAGDKLIKILHTPGHTKDSICLIFEDKIFTGDTLFLDDGGAGRDDLPGGDAGEHFDSLQRLMGLDDNLWVYPAHEYRHRNPSTLKHQKESNPHLRIKDKSAFLSYLQELKLGPAEWMKDVLKANYACARDPKAAWVPVDVPACEVKGTLSLSANDIKVSTISVDLLREKLKQDADVLVLDVRDPEELSQALGCIAGCENIPVSRVSASLEKIQSFGKKQIVTVCRSGGRALTAAQILLQSGFKDVKVLEGGMTKWASV